MPYAPCILARPVQQDQQNNWLTPRRSSSPHSSTSAFCLRFESGPGAQSPAIPSAHALILCQQARLSLSLNKCTNWQIEAWTVLPVAADWRIQDRPERGVISETGGARPTLCDGIVPVERNAGASDFRNQMGAPRSVGSFAERSWAIGTIAQDGDRCSGRRAQSMKHSATVEFASRLRGHQGSIMCCTLHHGSFAAAQKPDSGIKVCLDGRSALGVAVGVGIRLSKISPRAPRVEARSGQS